MLLFMLSTRSIVQTHESSNKGVKKDEETEGVSEYDEEREEEENHTRSGVSCTKSNLQATRTAATAANCTRVERDAAIGALMTKPSQLWATKTRKRRKIETL